MTKRKTIGENPLDAVVPKPAETRSSSNKTASKPKENVTKERLTVHLPADLIERVKNAVYWTPGLTLAKLAEKGLDRAVEDLEKQHKGPFPRRTEELKGGRPLK